MTSPFKTEALNVHEGPKRLQPGDRQSGYTVVPAIKYGVVGGMLCTGCPDETKPSMVDNAIPRIGDVDSDTY